MRNRAARTASWLAAHPVEVAFGLLVVIAFAYALRITGHSYFWADDFPVIRQGGSAAGLLDPYNNALSLVSVLSDHVLVEVFGFHHSPFQVLGLLGLFAVPSAYFLTTRRQFGAVLAALLAFPLLWYGRSISLYPGEFNHNLALTGAIVCAAALNRGKRADWVLAAALTLSLCSAGGGVAALAACIVHNLCTRPHVRRWLAVLGPGLLYLIWWLHYVGRTTDLGPYAVSTSQTLLLVRDLAYSAFDATALGNGVIAMGLVAAFAAYAIWALSKGLKNGANVLAWSIGVVAWGVGLANSRGVLASAGVFRYRFTSLGLVLLAVVPRRPIVWPARFSIDSDRRVAIAVAGIVLLVGSLRALAVRSDMQAFATQQTAFGRVTRGQSLVIGLGPSVIPDAARPGFNFGGLSAGKVRALFARYGAPFPATRATADQRLVDIGIVQTAVAATRDATCTPLSAPITYRSVGFDELFVWSRDAPFTVDVRRFGDVWVRLGAARAGETLQFDLPGLGATEPWQVRADGACLVGPRHR
jgi:hypothetical protein